MTPGSFRCTFCGRHIEEWGAAVALKVRGARGHEYIADPGPMHSACARWHPLNQQEFELTHARRKCFELAERYHHETEAYDRTVCTGPIIRGAVQPMTARELTLVNRNASLVLKRLEAEAREHGVSAKDLRAAISRIA